MRGLILACCLLAAASLGGTVAAQVETPAWRALNAQGDLLRLRGEYEEALRGYALAQRLAEAVEDRAGVALALTGMGRVHHDRLEWDTALEYHERSLAIGEAAGSRAAIAQALSNRGAVFYSRGDYDLAQRDQERSLALWQAEGEQRGAALAHNHLGNVAFSRQDYPLALERYGEALAGFRALGDRPRMAAVLGNVGVVYLSLSRYDEARAFLEQALAIQEAAGNKLQASITLLNLGNIHFARGDNALSMQAYLRSLSLLDELGELEGSGRVLNNLGGVYRAQGNFEVAADYYQRSLELHQRLGDKEGVAQELANLANARAGEGRYEVALDLSRRSLDLFREIGSDGGIATTLDSRGVILQDAGDYAAAEEHFNRSLELYRKIGNRAGVADVLVELAGLAEREHDDSEVLRLAASAAGEARAMGLPGTLWKASTLTGRAFLHQGRTEDARRALTEAIEIVEGLRRTTSGGEEDQQSFFEQKVEPYEAMVALLVGAGDADQAFAYVERTKARALLDVLERGRRRIVKSMSAEEEARERAYVDELADLNSRLRAARSDGTQPAGRPPVEEIEGRIERVRLDLGAFQTELYALHPDLQVKRGQAQPIGVAEVGELLDDPARAVLSYFVTADATYLFVLTMKSSAAAPRAVVHTIPIGRSALVQEVERFRLALAQLDPGFGEASRRLYDLLVRPAEAELDGSTELVVAADGALWEMPFQALQSAPGRYLIEDRAISYVPSLTVLRAMKRRYDAAPRTSPASRTLLAFGNPDFGGETRQRVERALMGETLTPLPEAERQVEALVRLYGPERATVYVGGEAREDRAKAEAGGYRILQFATHGTLDDRSPMYSHLVLAHPEGGREDGLLEAWEMMDLELRADLVVLAACETARGRVSTGEGMIGMSWALFVAGASTTVVSQWKVESASTTELMVELHRGLRDGSATANGEPRPALALRRAALRMLEDPRYRHPFYWAGFVVVGRG